MQKKETIRTIRSHIHNLSQRFKTPDNHLLKTLNRTALGLMVFGFLSHFASLGVTSAMPVEVGWPLFETFKLLSHSILSFGFGMSIANFLPYITQSKGEKVVFGNYKAHAIWEKNKRIIEVEPKPTRKKDRRNIFKKARDLVQELNAEPKVAFSSARLL